MSALMNPQPLPAHIPPSLSRYSPSRLGGRKRKADDEHEARGHQNDDAEMDHQMGTSPPSPGNYHKPNKKIRSSIQGRPLPLPRLLETVDTATLKNIIQTVCANNPEFAKEVALLAPKPTVASALSTLTTYEAAYRGAFPYGGNSTGDYAHNRVRPFLMNLLDALSDYTPHFLPPNEAQSSVSLTFLDGATDIIHRMPVWDNPIHNHARQMAYEEITKAWILVIQEAAKRGAGISLQYGGWETKLCKHNESSAGRMEPALTQMREVLGLASDTGITSRSQRPGSIGLGLPIGCAVPVRTW